MSVLLFCFYYVGLGLIFYRATYITPSLLQIRVASPQLFSYLQLYNNSIMIRLPLTIVLLGPEHRMVRGPIEIQRIIIIFH